MNSRSTAALAPASLAGHPIRRQVAVARRMRRPLAQSAAPLKGSTRVPMHGQDELKLFALSFTAFFVCIYALIF